MSYRVALEYGPLFFAYLEEKGALQDNRIKKEVARKMYFEEFKPNYALTNFSFSTMFSWMYYLHIISYKKGNDMMTVDANFLRDFSKNENTKRKPRARQAKVKPTKVDNKSKPKLTVAKKEPETECKLCDIAFVNSEYCNQHKKTEQHKLRTYYVQQVKSMKHSPSGILAEVVIGHGEGMETIAVDLKKSQQIVLHLINKTGFHINITEVIEVNNLPGYISLSKPTLPHLLKSNAALLFKIDVELIEYTFWEYPLIFKIQNLNESKDIVVLKQLIFQVISPLLDSIRPSVPYKRTNVRRYAEFNQKIIPGEFLEKSETDFKPKFPLAQYALTNQMIALFNANLHQWDGMSEQQIDLLTKYNKTLSNFEKSGTLAKDDYFQVLELLLFMEEHQMKINIQSYDVSNQSLSKAEGYKANFLELSVPGLSESRPSVLKGDSVFVRENSQSRDKYQGIVHKVKLDSVILGFSHRFVQSVHLPKKKYLVSFTFNRTTLRAEHQAINLAKRHKIIDIFCASNVQTRPLTNYKLHWYDPNITNNIMQQQAIKHILSETCRPLPYLIFGPPGTGKTVTIVEAVLQIWKLKADKKILVCAPSNSAANEITKRLIKHVPKRDILRYVALSYPIHIMQKEIKPYTNYNNVGQFYHPNLDALKSYRMIVSTVVNAVRLINVGFPPNHFSYVFIDESGQATETETLIPIAGILSNSEETGAINGQIILAGDPKQLGPVIHSKLAQKYGFDISMLERFMTFNDGYKRDENDSYNASMLTKLVKCYRSHPALVQLPNELFYDNELVPAEERALTNIAEGWSELPNPKFPVVFHRVIGKDEREGNSPSFFNLQEVQVVIEYLDKLVGKRLSGMVIKQNDIAVITPYNKQVEKIKNVCTKKNWTDLSICSVEQFQGQERLIIIVSTVRSKPEFLEDDEKFHLGFLTNPKRFNVALTRSKALLIVVGNPKILQHDKYWHAFIKYCIDNNSVVGTKFEFATTYETADVAGANADDDAPSFSRGNV